MTYTHNQLQLCLLNSKFWHLVDRVFMLSHCLYFIYIPSTFYIPVPCPPVPRKFSETISLVQLIIPVRLTACFSSFWAAAFFFLPTSKPYFFKYHCINLNTAIQHLHRSKKSSTRNMLKLPDLEWCFLTWSDVSTISSWLWEKGAFQEINIQTSSGMTMITKNPHGWASICTTVFFNKVLVPYHDGYWKRLILGCFPTITMASLNSKPNAIPIHWPSFGKHLRVHLESFNLLRDGNARQKLWTFKRPSPE